MTPGPPPSLPALDDASMHEIIGASVALTQKLVRVPSVSPGSAGRLGSPEAGICKVLQRACSGHDIAWQYQEVLPDRHNFLLSQPKPGAPKILFLAHMDTVATDGMDDPFSGAIKDNRLWGRGACDDKGPLAAVVAVLLGLKDKGVPLAYDVTVAATVDEESSMAGAAVLAKKNPAGWDLCVGLEPTLLQPVSAHRGVYRCRILAPKGRALPVSEIMGHLKKVKQVVERSKHAMLGQAVMTCTELKDDGSVHRILVDVRMLPEHSPAAIHASIVQAVGDRGKVVPLFAGVGIDTDPETALVKSFQSSLHAQGLDDRLVGVHFCTDCSQLQGRGPCLVWGPGNPKQAHHIEEFIDIEQLETSCQVLAKFLSES